MRILTLFGTRPEVIKLAPVIRALEAHAARFEVLTVSSSQHTDLLAPFVRWFGLRVDRDLEVGRAGQGPSDVAARVLAALDPLLARERPDAVVVQGDTTTALAGALGAFHRRVPVVHVEAGLRSGDLHSPFPEEMNRRVISRVATYHLAATRRNVELLRAEGVPAASIALTGNPVVDALRGVLAEGTPGPAMAEVLRAQVGRRLLVLTTHRRESFGERMAENLAALRRFVAAREDTALVFPVHPNPAVRDAAASILGGVPRVHLVPPLEYADFVHLLSRAWLVVSDSGGVQEEVATLGKPLLILRDTTERPEVVEAGIGRLVGGAPGRLEALLAEAEHDRAWFEHVRSVENPFGDGRAGPRIADALERWLAGEGGTCPT